MVGEFRHANGQAFVMIVNLSLERSARFTFKTRQPCAAIQVVSAMDGSLTPFETKDGLWLVAGQGALLSLQHN